MGMHEDDRIRAKNKVQQEAYNLYSMLSNEGLSDSAIADSAQELLALDPTNPRNEVFSTILKIVGRTHDNEEVSSGRSFPRSGSTDSE